MAEKFKNKYRIASHRNPYWDYSSDALYFLTIVTQNRECNLGKIVETVDSHNRSFKMELSDFGKIVEQEWIKSFEIRNELILHEYVIMPNHMHAIVEIYNEIPGTQTDEQKNDINQTETAAIVETHGRVSLPIEPTSPESFPIEPTSPATLPIEPTSPESFPIVRNPPTRMPKSISSFMAGFKSSVNSKIDDYIDQYQLDIPKYNRHNHFFQPNYHDHIIRNHKEYVNISRYIIRNPQNWKKDTFKGSK